MNHTNTSLINNSGKQQNIAQLIKSERPFVVNGWAQSHSVGKKGPWALLASPSCPPEPRALLSQSDQSSEPVINKDPGREVNRGHWAWM